MYSIVVWAWKSGDESFLVKQRIIVRSVNEIQTGARGNSTAESVDWWSTRFIRSSRALTCRSLTAECTWVEEEEGPVCTSAEAAEGRVCTSAEAEEGLVWSLVEEEGVCSHLKA